MANSFEGRFKGLVGAAYRLKTACESLGYRRIPNLAVCRDLQTSTTPPKHADQATPEGPLRLGVG